MIDLFASVVCAAALICGLLILIKPSILKRHSRWDGAASLLLAPVAVGISMMTNPTVSQPGETLESMREAGIGIVLLFGCLSVGAFVIGSARSKARFAPVNPVGRKELSLEESLRQQREWVAAQKAAKSDAPKKTSHSFRQIWHEAKAKQSEVEQANEVLAPDRASDEVDTRTRDARRAKLEAPIEPPAPKLSWFQRQQVKLEEKRKSDALMAEIRAKIEAEKSEGIGPRLESYYASFRAGEITLEEYKAEVLELQADTKEDLRLTRACRSDAVRTGTLDEHEEEIEQLQNDLEECAWRLRWIKDKAYKQSISRDGFDDKGKWARFEYVDADGEVTNRTITMWEKRGAYIVGYDKSRKAERTFRQDRISEWVSG